MSASGPSSPVGIIPNRRSGTEPYGLEVEHLTKHYGKRAVVHDLSFTASAGRVTGFLGPNGSGKSTTMKILLGLASADLGRATIGGYCYRDLPDPAATVGVLIEPNAFHPGRSGQDHLLILADVGRVPKSRVSEVLSLVGLNTDAARRHVGAYSLGMRQRLSLASALLTDPPVLVLDEPGNGLDPQGIRTLRDLLRARAEKGDTILVSSHLLAEVEHLADDVVVVSQGRLVTYGTIEELLNSGTLVRTASAEGLMLALESAGAAVELRDPQTLTVRGMPIEEIGERAFAAGIVLHELSAQTGTLEELFLDWTREEASEAEVVHL